MKAKNISKSLTGKSTKAKAQIAHKSQAQPKKQEI